MNATRILLLLIMAGLVYVMVVMPGMWDSKRRADAHRAHAEAPTETTRMRIEEAKRLDWEDIKRFELICAGAFLVCFYIFKRAKPRGGGLRVLKSNG